MRVFISSVRQELAEERDHLPALIRAIGHEPERFEDFTAPTSPSREACLAAVQACDVYVLLLGPKYGYVFPETNQSATEDEWTAARALGKRIVVFRKADLVPEPRQAEFIAKVGDYAIGQFWKEFSSTAELQTQLVAALREIELAPSPLDYQPLPDAPQLVWRDDWAGEQNAFGQPTLAELIVVSLDTPPFSDRILQSHKDGLLHWLRTSGFVAPSTPLEATPGYDPVIITVSAPNRRGWNDVALSQLRGIRLSKDGQLSVWWTLPTDSMGPVVDPPEMTEWCAKLLRALNAVSFLTADRFAVALGLNGTMTMVSIDRVTTMPRTRSTSLPSGAGVRLVPDESVSSAAFTSGADDVARNLVNSLITGLSPN